MSSGACDDSFQGVNDWLRPRDVWLHEIPILLRAKAMRPGNGSEFFCAGAIWLRRREGHPGGVDGSPLVAANAGRLRRKPGMVVFFLFEFNEPGLTFVERISKFVELFGIRVRPHS